MNTLTNPKLVLDFMVSHGAVLQDDSRRLPRLTGLLSGPLPVTVTAVRLLRAAQCIGDDGRATPRGVEVRGALGLYEACLYAMGCDDTSHSHSDLSAAVLQGLLRREGGDYEITERGQGLVARVGAAKAAAAAGGPVVWPGAAVRAVQEFLAVSEAERGDRGPRDPRESGATLKHERPGHGASGLPEVRAPIPPLSLGAAGEHAREDLAALWTDTRRRPALAERAAIAALALAQQQPDTTDRMGEVRDGLAIVEAAELRRALAAALVLLAKDAAAEGRAEPLAGDCALARLPAEGQVLAALLRRPEGLQLQDVGDLCVGHHTACRVLVHLAIHGLVKIGPGNLMLLTPRGLKVALEVPPDPAEDPPPPSPFPEVPPC